MTAPRPPVIDRPWVMPPEGQPVPSPCINVCRMDAAGALCLGCRRTIAEISAWSRLDDAARREVWAQLLQRGPTGDPA